MNRRFDSIDGYPLIPTRPGWEWGRFGLVAFLADVVVVVFAVAAVIMLCGAA
jgi:hypothetical protein